MLSIKNAVKNYIYIINYTLISNCIDDKIKQAYGKTMYNLYYVYVFFNLMTYKLIVSILRDNKIRHSMKTSILKI